MTVIELTEEDERQWKERYWRIENMPKTEFTKVHADIYKHYSRTWRRTAYSTGPVNKPRAAKAIQALYKLEGLDEPLIIWTKSPLASLFAKAIADHYLKIRPEYDVWPSIGPRVVSHVHDETYEFTMANNKTFHNFRREANSWDDFSHIGEIGVRRVNSILKESLHNAVLHSGHFVNAPHSNQDLYLKLWEGVSDSLEHSLGASLKLKLNKDNAPEFFERIKGCIEANRAAMNRTDYEDSGNYDQIRRSIWAAKENNYYTQYDAAKLSEYMFFCDAGLIAKTDSLIELYQLCSSVGAVMPEGRVCYVSDRPEIIKLDSEDQLHCEDSPAIKYSDGFSIYAWHGERFPHDWAQSPSSPSEALRWPNLEQRRVACEFVGWDNIIDELEGQLIDKDDDPEIGELIRVILPDSGAENFLRVTCGTGRRFALPVPPDMKTARQANAWTWGLRPDQYRPEVRT